MAVSELERDALVEAFNIGIGAAAASFSEMVGEEVLLNLPTLEVVQAKAVATMALEQSSVCGVNQEFRSSFGAGKAIVFFPEARSLELVRVLMGEALDEGEEMAELEQEALTEVGNVVLNACLAGLSNLIGEEFDVTLPNFRRCTAGELVVEADEPDDEEVVVLLKIRFDLKHRALDGHLAFLLSVGSLQSLASRLLEKLGLSA